MDQMHTERRLTTKTAIKGKMEGRWIDDSGWIV